MSHRPNRHNWSYYERIGGRFCWECNTHELRRDRKWKKVDMDDFYKEMLVTMEYRAALKEVDGK